MKFGRIIITAVVIAFLAICTVTAQQLSLNEAVDMPADM